MTSIEPLEDSNDGEVDTSPVVLEKESDLLTLVLNSLAFPSMFKYSVKILFTPNPRTGPFAGLIKCELGVVKDVLYGVVGIGRVTPMVL